MHLRFTSPSWGNALTLHTDLGLMPELLLARDAEARKLKPVYPRAIKHATVFQHDSCDCSPSQLSFCLGPGVSLIQDGSAWCSDMGSQITEQMRLMPHNRRRLKSFVLTFSVSRGYLEQHAISSKKPTQLTVLFRSNTWLILDAIEFKAACRRSTASSRERGDGGTHGC